MSKAEAATLATAATAAAPALDPKGVRRIAVFRALMLGDLLCATPALRALRSGFPRARISLIGLPWARELVERLASVDDFIEFPGWPGLPERPLADPAQGPAFVASMRMRQFDLAVQLHGSGSVVNPLVAGFGARRMAGFFDPAGAVPADDTVLSTPWPTTGTEVERLLALTDRLGLPRQGEQLDFPLRDADRRRARALLPERETPYVVVHAGSQLPSRRWPVGRFAAVALTLAERGLEVVLTGSAREAGLTAQLARSLRSPALDLAGKTDLWTLGALIEGAALLLCNDTGVSHIAAALATRSVVVASGGDALRWAPADAQRHRVLWHDLSCRPCAYIECPIGHPCATAIGVDEVRRSAIAALPVARPEAVHG